MWRFIFARAGTDDRPVHLSRPTSGPEADAEPSREASSDVTRGTTPAATRHARLEATLDATLVARVRAGDERAFETLFHALYEPLVGYAARQTGDTTSAEDAVQAVFADVWRRRASLAPSTGIRQYVYGAVRYHLRDTRRGDRRRITALERYGAERRAGPSPLDSLDAMADREDEMRRYGALRDALAALSPRAREGLMLVRDHGLSYQEAAAVMGVSVNTLKTQLARAIRALRSAIGALPG